MRTRIAFLALVMTSGCGGTDVSSQGESGQRPAVSAPVSSESVPPEIADSVLNWSKCRAAKLLVLAKTDIGDEEAVDEAFKECVGFERATANVWEKHYGPNSASQIQSLKSRWRLELIANVKQLRDGTPISGRLEKNWGACVGGKIPNPLPNNVTPDSIVDAAMNACAPEMQRTQATYAQQHGDAEAAIYVEQMRLNIRKLALSVVAESRSPR